MLFVFLTTVLREGTVALRPEVVLPQQLLLVVLLGPLDEPRVQRANVVPGEPPNSRGLLEPEIVRLERRHVDRRQRVLEVLHVVGDVLLRFAQTDRRVLPRRNQAARIIRASISSTGAVPTVFNALARKYVSCSPKAIRTHSGSFTKSGERWFKPPAAWRSPVVSVPLCRAQLHCDPSLFTLRVDRHLFCVQNKPNDRMPTFPC